MTGTTSDPRVHSAFNGVRILIIAVFIVSLGALAFAVVDRGDHQLVNTVVWIRGIAVAAAAVILFAFAVFAEGGRSWAYRRLRILSFLIPCGVVLLIVAPGTFPVWMKVEQAVCGILILMIGLLLTRRHVREIFTKSSRK